MNGLTGKPDLLSLAGTVSLNSLGRDTKKAKFKLTPYPLPRDFVNRHTCALK